MTQPDALRLADLIDWPSIPYGQEAAAELRRLHDLLGKANALCRIRHEIIQAREDECLTHSAAVYEATRLLSEAREQRDALLEALKEIVAAADGDGWDQLDASFAKAREAIAKAEGQK